MKLEDVLRGLEQDFGGMHTNVPRLKVSKHDPRTKAELQKGGMTGGDRMTHHKYAGTYADELRRLETLYSGGLTFVKPPEPSSLDPKPRPTSVFDGHRMQAAGAMSRARNYAPLYERELHNLRRGSLVIVELGILRGVGLAIWCELFPQARVIGLDVDTSHFKNNLVNLQARGAFKHNTPEVYEFDELSPKAGVRLDEILRGVTIDVMIDDALHYEAAIMQAFDVFIKRMSPNYVYFIEDNVRVFKHVGAAYPRLFVQNHGAMTVVKPKTVEGAPKGTP